MDLPLVNPIHDENMPFFEANNDLDELEFIIFGIPRQIYERSNYFDRFDETAFRRRFRLSRQCVLHLLQEIQNELEFNNNLNNCVSPMNQLLTCLRLYSTGGHLQEIADFIGMHLSTVSRIVKRVSLAIAQLYGLYVKFPQTAEDIDQAQLNFFNIAAFPRVIGALDCTHIKVQSPGGADAEVYRNRKQYFSINTQMICDANLKITNVVARWPGSAHDSTIYNHSTIKYDFDNNYQNCILLGDSGYPNGDNLLTPFLRPRTPAEHLYNESHIRSRNVIERCFGVLKRRFPILAYGCRLKIDTVLTIIVATSILHNLALQYNEHDPPPLPPEIHENELMEHIQGGQIRVNNQHDQLQQGTRQFLVENYFQQL